MTEKRYRTLLLVTRTLSRMKSENLVPEVHLNVSVVLLLELTEKPLMV